MRVRWDMRVDGELAERVDGLARDTGSSRTKVVEDALRRVLDPSTQVACRFFGGPWDGWTVMRDDAPYRIHVPQLGFDDFVYRRCGPIHSGTAEYELVDPRVPQPR